MASSRRSGSSSALLSSPVDGSNQEGGSAVSKSGMEKEKNVVVAESVEVVGAETTVDGEAAWELLVKEKNIEVAVGVPAESLGKSVSANRAGEVLEGVVEVSKPLYSSIVQNKPTLSSHDLKISMVDGSPTVEIPDDIIEGAAPLWDEILIGRFLAAAPHVAKVHVIVNKIWTLRDKNLKVDVFVVDQTTMKFRIRDKSARNRVLRRRMWNIANIPLIVSKWSLEPEEAQPEITTMLMWIVLKNVPHKIFHWKGLEFLASAVGTPKKLHPDTDLCKSFD